MTWQDAHHEIPHRVFGGVSYSGVGTLTEGRSSRIIAAPSAPPDSSVAIWFSDDSGGHWRSTTSGIEHLAARMGMNFAVLGLASCTDSSGTVFISLGASGLQDDDTSSSSQTIGVFRSLDNGES